MIQELDSMNLVVPFQLRTFYIINSFQSHPEGFSPKIIRSLGQRLQPNGKKLQMKSQGW